MVLLCSSTSLHAANQDVVRSILHIFQKGNSKKKLNHVQISWGHQKVESDSEGRASIEIPSTGDGSVRFILGGYEPLELRYDLLRPSGEFDIYLIPSIEGENLIVITGKKQEQQISRKTISIDEAAKVAPNADPVQVIKLMPGVQSRQYRAEPIIRGSGPNDSRYYIDNFEVPFLFHGVGDLSVIPGSMVQDVKFDSGGFGPENGDATGGIVVARTKTEIPEHPKTEFVVNLPFYSGIFHTRPLSESSALSVGLRRSYIDIVIRKLLEERNKKNGKEQGTLTLVPYFADAQAVYWERKEDSYTKYSLIGAYDGLKAAFPSSVFADLQGQASVEFYTGFANFGIEHSTKLSHGWRITTTPQVYYHNTNVNIFGQTFATQDWAIRIPTEWKNHLNSTQDLSLGIDPALHFTNVRHNAIVYHGDDPTFDPEDAPITKAQFLLRYTVIATWANIDQKLGNLTLSPGIRVFENSEIKKTSADPRLRMRYTLDEKNTLKAAVGQYSESPNAAAASPQIGNPKLGFERSYHYILGLNTYWSERWESEFQLYYKNTFNVVSPDLLTQYNNKGSFKSYGFEAFVRRHLTERFFAWLSYTFSRTIARKSSQEVYRTSQYDQTHNLYLVGNYKLSTTWELGGRFNFHTGDTYTPISHGVYNASLDKYEARIAPGSEYSARLPPFDSLSFYFGHDWLYDTWKLNLRFGMESCWFTPQVLRISYNYDYTKENKETGLSNIPFLELRGEF